MAEDIALKKEIVVRRTDREFLLKIKRGEFSYDELVDMADRKIENISKLFRESDLPQGVDKGFLNKLLVKIRRDYYAQN